jgi:hypothetical protein
MDILKCCLLPNTAKHWSKHLYHPVESSPEFSWEPEWSIQTFIAWIKWTSARLKL